MKINNFWCVLLIITGFLFFTPIHAAISQSTSKSASLSYKLFKKNTYVSKNSNKTKQEKLTYHLLYPQNYDSSKIYPLVLFLHGAGSRGDAKLSTTHIRPWALSAENREKYPCFLLIPLCEKKHRWVEVDWGASSHKQPSKMSTYLSLTHQLLQDLQKTLPVDTSRIYLTGISMGGFGVWDLASRSPKTFAAIVPICGGADEQTATTLKNMPIWVFHGAKDRVVSPSRSRNMMVALRRIGSTNITYTEYPNQQHASWNPAYKNEKMWVWLFNQRKR